MLLIQNWLYYVNLLTTVHRNMQYMHVHVYDIVWVTCCSLLRHQETLADRYAFTFYFPCTGYGLDKWHGALIGMIRHSRWNKYLGPAVQYCNHVSAEENGAYYPEIWTPVAPNRLQLSWGKGTKFEKYQLWMVDPRGDLDDVGYRSWMWEC